MGQESPFQFQEAAPQQMYTTSGESEIYGVTPGSHQNTSFSGLVNPQPFTQKQEIQTKSPIAGDLWFFGAMVVVWQVGRVLLKKVRKSVPVLLLLCCFGSMEARDVVWKYSFNKKCTKDGRIIGATFAESKCCNKTLYFTNTYTSGVQRISYTNINCYGLKMSNRNSGNGEGDIIEQTYYNKINKVTIKYNFLGKKTTHNNYIYLRDFNSDSYNQDRYQFAAASTNQISLTPNDSIWTVNINAPQNGILIHIIIQDSILLKSIEIEYEDNGLEVLNNYKFLDGKNNLAFAFADTATKVHTLTDDSLIVASLTPNDWSHVGWSSGKMLDNSVAPSTISIGGSTTSDSIFNAVYEHTRPAGNPFGTCTESRYYTLYTETDTTLGAGGYETDEDVLFPDGVKYKMSIDDSRFYYFSLPFDCPMSWITFSNNTIADYVTGVSADSSEYVGDWLITRWDESQYQWHDMTSAELQSQGLIAGVGYGIGIVPDVETDVVFNSAYNQTIRPLHNDTIPISFTYPVQSDTTGCKSGWNFLGTRFFQKIDYLKMNTSYVLVANDTNLGWTLYSHYDENQDTLFDIKPFSAFMVQTDRDLVYDLTNAQAIVAVDNRENHFNLVIRQEEDQERMDYTTIVANPDYTDEYEIGMDMGKMITRDMLPQIFSVSDSTYYAINASGYDVGSKINVGVYIPHKENWVISLGHNIHIPEGWHIIIKDNSTGVKKDLTVEDLQFSLKKGFYPKRFDVEISDMPLGVDVVDIEGEAEWMRIVTVSGIVIYEGEYDESRLEGLVEGFYIVQTDKGCRKIWASAMYR